MSETQTHPDLTPTLDRLRAVLGLASDATPDVVILRVTQLKEAENVRNTNAERQSKIAHLQRVCHMSPEMAAQTLGNQEAELQRQAAEAAKRKPAETTTPTPESNPKRNK